MKNGIVIFLLASCFSSFGQGNCLIYPEGSRSRKACEICYKALEHRQGSKESQMMFDSAIAVGPDFAWSYFEKSVPYFKRGFLYEGIQILNKAVELEPVNYLCYRASWFWQYKNYDLCIQDLEAYYALPDAYLQYTPGGEMNMEIVLGLAYAKNENYAKAVETLENFTNSYQSKYEIGFFDYHVLGVMYVHNKQYNKAIEAFKKQLTIVDNIADSYYYLGLAYKGLSDKDSANLQFEKALLLLKDKNRHRINIGYPVSEDDVYAEM